MLLRSDGRPSFREAEALAKAATSPESLRLMRLANCIVQHGLSHEHAWQAAHQVDTLEIHLPGGYSRVKASSAILANNALLRDSQVTAILDRYRLVAPPRPKRAHSHTHAHAFHNLGDADYLRLAAQYGVSMTRELVRSTRSYY